VASELSSERLRDTRSAIEDLNAAFVYYLDHGHVDELAALFTENALYTHAERRSSGRAEIRELFRKRLSAGPRTSRHLYSGLRIAVESETRATATCVCLTFAADGVPPLPATPLLVADFEDVYERGEDGRWRFLERHIHRVFESTDNPGPVGSEKL
jgi:ketosteroid isomerase-like protein